MTDAGASRRKVERRSTAGIDHTDDLIANEVPVALHYNGQPFTVLMATPCDLADLALGFSLSEGIVEAASDARIDDISETVDGFRVAMTIPQAHADRLTSRDRTLPGYGGCGICGSREVESVLRVPPLASSTLQIDERALHRALDTLRACQPLNAATGATHAAGFADTDGELLLVREDVGRHNALDKLVGAVTSSCIEAGGGFVVVTSRASYELVMKAAQVGIPLLAAISAPTTLAIALADSSNLCLVAFARDGQCSVYAHTERLLHGQ